MAFAVSYVIIRKKSSSVLSQSFRANLGFGSISIHSKKNLSFGIAFGAVLVDLFLYPSIKEIIKVLKP